MLLPFHNQIQPSKTGLPWHDTVGHRPRRCASARTAVWWDNDLHRAWKKRLKEGQYALKSCIALPFHEYMSRLRNRPIKKTPGQWSPESRKALEIPLLSDSNKTGKGFLRHHPPTTADYTGDFRLYSQNGRTAGRPGYPGFPDLPLDRESSPPYTLSYQFHSHINCFPPAWN